MHEDPSRIVKFVWAGANGKPRGSYTMTHDPENDFSSFIPGNVSALFYNLPGASGNLNTRVDTPASVVLASDTAKFWFEVTERGRKSVLDQNGVGFPLGPTSVLLAEGSCLLLIVSDDSETLNLIIQIGVSRCTAALPRCADASSPGHEGDEAVERQRPVLRHSYR
jgi:hypothetical protein